MNRTGHDYLTSYYVTRHNTFRGLTRRVSWSRNPDRYRIGSSFGFVFCSISNDVCQWFTVTEVSLNRKESYRRYGGG